MLFVTLPIDNITLPEAKIKAQRILDYDKKYGFLNDVQKEQLTHITKPTLNVSQHTDEIIVLWRELVQTLVMYNDKGVELRFFVDEVQRVLYFGDEEGLMNAQKFYDDDRPLNR
ncbi:MAG: hypothetical protein Q3971_07230 [Moraxella sp.]|nr:hypothetical protein [Moraxella sp.]